jgi:hypothetical protein
MMSKKFLKEQATVLYKIITSQTDVENVFEGLFALGIFMTESGLELTDLRSEKDIAKGDKND